MPDQRRRTIGSDDELRVLGGLAVITSRIEFLTRELLIALIDPTNPEVGVAITKGWRFEQCSRHIEGLLPIRFDDENLAPRGLAAQAMESARVTMNARNRYLHSRFHWDREDPAGAGPTVFTHKRATGENSAERISPAQLEEVADNSIRSLADVTVAVQTVTQHLDIEEQYWDRVYRTDVPALGEGDTEGAELQPPQ